MGSEKNARRHRRGGECEAVFGCFTDSCINCVTTCKPRRSPAWPWRPPGCTQLPVYVILEAAGLEVCVVNEAHVKNVPGRKTDVQDCQWLAQLMPRDCYGAGLCPRRRSANCGLCAPCARTMYPQPGKPAHPAHAKVTGPDEPQDSRRAQRDCRGQLTAHGSGDRGRGTRPRNAAGPVRPGM